MNTEYGEYIDSDKNLRGNGKGVRGWAHSVLCEQVEGERSLHATGE